MYVLDRHIRPIGKFAFVLSKPANHVVLLEISMWGKRVLGT